MSALKRFVCAAVLAALVMPVTAAAPVIVSLSTEAPNGSTWYKGLLDMGALWKTKTAERVQLKVYPGGQQGSEAAIVKMLRPGVEQMQAALLTASGLAEVDEAFNVLGMPFFFRSDDEAAAVLQKLSPMLEKRLEAKGFKLLCWGSGGWVQVFSKMPLKTLDDVKKAKLYTSSGDDKMIQWYRRNGFNPRALNAGDIPAQLRIPNGAIDATPMPPYPASVLNIFRDAKYMLDLRVAPLIGALVMTSGTWAKIDAADQKIVLETAKAFEEKVMADTPKQDSESVTQMKARGLTVTTLPPAAEAEFRAAAEKMVPTLEGAIVPADAYKLAVQERDAFRKSKGAK